MWQDMAGQKENNTASEYTNAAAQAAEYSIRLPEDVRFILRQLEEAGHEAFAVGGCVRDSLLGRVPEDWDITTSAKPEEVKAVFPKTVDTGIAHGTVTVLLKKRMHGSSEQIAGHDASLQEKGTQKANANSSAAKKTTGTATANAAGRSAKFLSYEVTTYRIDGTYRDGRHPEHVTFTPSLEEDLKRRDFTINAMAYNESRGLVDLFCGRSDLKRGIIRCVGEPKERFAEDALRMLRAVRFAAQLGFAIDTNTRDAAVHLAENLHQVSKERILAELSKLLCAAHAGSISLLQELGLSACICKDFSHIPFHAFETLCTGYAAPFSQTGGKSSERQNRSEQLSALSMRLSAYHADASAFDLSRETSVKNRYARFALLFCGLSQEMPGAILKELKADNDTIRKVSVLAAAGQKPIPIDRYALKKLLQTMTPELFADLLLMQAALGHETEQAASLFLDIMRLEEPVYTKDLAVKGADLLRAGIPAGPKIGKILEAMLEDVLHEPVHNSVLYLLSQHLWQT